MLADHDVESPLQKAVAGLHDGIALHGGDLIEPWRAQAEYPDGLARAPIDQTQDCNLAELRPCVTGQVR